LIIPLLLNNKATKGLIVKFFYSVLPLITFFNNLSSPAYVLFDKPSAFSKPQIIAFPFMKLNS